MSAETTFRNKERNPVKTISAWIGVLAIAGGAVMAFAKSYYVTPVIVEQHGAAIQKLEKRADDTATELRNQRDILLEIRGDIKVLNRQNRTRTADNN